MKKVVVCGIELHEEALNMLRDVARVIEFPGSFDERLLKEVSDADAIILGPTPHATRELMGSATRLKHIARVGVGVDNVDLEAATEHHIFVTNTPEVTADAVAEFTMALLLSLAKNIPRCDSMVRSGNWHERNEIVFSNIELKGKTHGIVGLGRIGRRVALRCKAFDMKVIYYKRHRDFEFEQEAGVQYRSFDSLIRESDSISLHLPLTPETTNLFDRPQFHAMKRNALLINQARGRVVNEDALIEALREGRIGGYATDVYEKEPPEPQSELFKFKNVVVAPHVGGGTKESRLRSSKMAAEEVIRVLRGEPPNNLVNRNILNASGY